MNDQTFAYRDEAIAAALLESEPGDVVFVHEVYCAMEQGDPCNCQADELVVPETLA